MKLLLIIVLLLALSAAIIASMDGDICVSGKVIQECDDWPMKDTPDSLKWKIRDEK